MGFSPFGNYPNSNFPVPIIQNVAPSDDPFRIFCNQGKKRQGSGETKTKPVTHRNTQVHASRKADVKHYRATPSLVRKRSGLISCLLWTNCPQKRVARGEECVREFVYLKVRATPHVAWKVYTLTELDWCAHRRHSCGMCIRHTIRTLHLHHAGGSSTCLHSHGMVFSETAMFTHRAHCWHVLAMPLVNITIGWGLRQWAAM